MILYNSSLLYFVKFSWILSCGLTCANIQYSYTIKKKIIYLLYWTKTAMC